MMAFYSEIMKTALNQLEDWILKFERQNGTPTMCEIKAQLEMFKEIEKQQIVEAVNYGYELDFSDDDNTYTKGDEYFYESFTCLGS